MNNDIIVIDNLQIQDLIYTIRGVQVMLDRDLAVLYQIETRALKQAVKRNISRFPPEFMFELVENEMNFLVSQSVIPSRKYFGGAKPYAFTEQGVAMLSAVLSYRSSKKDYAMIDIKMNDTASINCAISIIGFEK
jgi:hypothetical protein